MNIQESGTVVRVFCPYCDRAYLGSTQRAAENRVVYHIKGQHPDRPNPYEK